MLSINNKVIIFGVNFIAFQITFDFTYNATFVESFIHCSGFNESSSFVLIISKFTLFLFDH